MNAWQMMAYGFVLLSAGVGAGLLIMGALAGARAEDEAARANAAEREVHELSERCERAVADLQTAKLAHAIDVRRLEDEKQVLFGQLRDARAHARNLEDEMHRSRAVIAQLTPAESA